MTDIGKRLKSLKIGNVTLGGNVLLAPLAGYTDFAFREMCIRYGADLAFTEMVSCKGLVYGGEKTRELLRTSPLEKVKAVQVFGREPDIMRRAAESEDLQKFDIIDVNMGCPVPKLYKNGEGSALLSDFDTAGKIVSELKKTGKEITVKMRIGVTRDKLVSAEFAKMLEDAGASMITVHGRTREEYYSGEPDYGEIGSAVNAVKIPVIGNGGIDGAAAAEKMFAETGCAGIMIARYALYKPYVFAEIKGEKIMPPFSEAVVEQINSLASAFGEKHAAVNLRKQIACYLKGIPGSKKYKEEVFSAKDTETLIGVVEKILRQYD